MLFGALPGRGNVPEGHSRDVSVLQGGCSWVLEQALELGQELWETSTLPFHVPKLQLSAKQPV